jgi:hypothetical protein
MMGILVDLDIRFSQQGSRDFELEALPQFATLGTGSAAGSAPRV